MSSAQVRRELYDLVSEFIVQNEITSAETIYQMDHVSENFYEFMEQVCELVGYAEYVDDEEEEE